MEDGTLVWLQNEWRCLICETRLSSGEQMKAHVSGKRHAANFAYYLAKGTDLWFGDPKSSRNKFWSAVRDLIPEYDCIFDTECTFPVVNERSCNSKTSILENIELPTKRAGVPGMYRNVLPLGQYFCELCADLSSSKASFSHHLSGSIHKESLGVFQSIEADYFQRVFDPFTNNVFYLALVSRSVVNAISGNSSVAKLLPLQWRVSGKHPEAHGTLMQADPSDVLSLFD